MRCAWLVAAAVQLAAHAPADEPPREFSVVAPKGFGIEALDLNNRGDVIGFEWAEEPGMPGVMSQRPFLARGKAMTYLPLLQGYTFTFPAAISDDGLVVGRVSKPAPPGAFVPLRNQAFTWDERSGIRGIGTLEGDNASFACGVSRDGRRISGFSIGPDRKRACYWERDGDHWKATPLPQESAILGSNVVAISDNGNLIAAVDAGSCCLWSCGPDGTWTREVIAPGEDLVPRAVNDEGTVVGLRHPGDGNPRAVLWTRAGGVQVLDLPEGYARSEATAVNNAGVVVGMMDGPRGSVTGPTAFAYEGGRVRILPTGGLPLVGATAINDRRQVAGTLEIDDEEAAPPDAPGDEPPDSTDR